ncbi:phosphinothricin acetyltransferase [Nocardioides sp. BE266]|uniref:GNAT family N-acetyltransferase n=1 Tax=Nocardioides sp. BE266 TaxID=2817725 RepID=UPI00285E5245|nr:N-acetyltransferase family protein [Nocardioides sp. BE266]MDR7255242.1 phosphinothricin acetyltransferase [Nocardioides sp. BE266]
MDIRRALPADLPAVSAIYAREAREGYATFDLEPRPMALWEEKLESGDHFLVAEHDGDVIGYASSAPFRPKPAYGHTRETGVYVAPGHQGLGTGRALYDALLARLVEDRVHTVVAGVALPNPASLALHRACGFEQVGVMREVGRKFDRWIDLAWLQKVLA